MVIKRIDANDNIEEVCAQLAPDLWGEDNDMAVYEPEMLMRFLAQKNNVLVVGYADDRIVCSALCYILEHPDPSRRSLYIDELDTHPAYRRKGYASEMTVWLRVYAKDQNLPDVWLTTEAEDNDVANKFYQSLEPKESLLCKLYSYDARSK